MGPTTFSVRSLHKHNHGFRVIQWNYWVSGLDCIGVKIKIDQWCVYLDPTIEKLGKSVGIMTLLHVI